MARPKKHDIERRDSEIKIRYTQLEADFVQQQADEAGLSRAAFIRKRCLGERVVAPRLRGLDPSVVVELNRLCQEINAIGNNVNQIARAVNSDRRLPPSIEYISEAFEALKLKAENTLDRLASSDGA